MIHLGDITKINGAEIEPVDCITGGSPCQDLSVAGKRAGLAGERSGLFMEQIRVIKEMRQHEKECGRADEFIRPRWMVWENVPGAFSSNDGEDFRAVLEETARIVDETAVIPRLAKGQKWTPAGCIMGDGWSIAWRVHDAQFWGVPQRRKRISLVADFGGTTAPEILFERKGVSGDPEQSGTAGQDAATDVRSGVEETGRAVSFQERAGKPGGGKGILIQDEHTGALSTLNNQSVVYGISAYDSNSMKSPNPNSGIYKAETARTLDLNGGSPACNQGGMAVVSMATKQLSQNIGDNVAMPICANNYKEPQVVCLEGNGQRPSHQGNGYAEGETMYTLNSTEHHAVCFDARGNGNGQIAPTITGDHQDRITDYTAIAVGEVAASLCAQDGRGGVHSQRLADPEGNFVIEAITSDGDKVSGTLDASYYKGCGERQGKERTVIIEPVTASKASHFTTGIEGGIADTLYATDYKEAQMIAYGIDRAAYNQGKNAKFDFSVEEDLAQTIVAKGPGGIDKTIGALCARDYKGVGNQYVSEGKLIMSDTENYIVRRLTPMECERLQGYPDGWTNIGDWTDSKGKVHKGDSDSPRYKALGNSIALPFWFYLLRRISATYERPATLGSLFDGIGGFPLCWETCNGKGTARWASEIEEFPIAVTKKHFKEDT